MINADWSNIKVLILDVDGTLYDQSALRKKMLFQLLKYYLFRPFQLNDLLVLHHFRLARERKAGYEGNNLEEKQYEWCAEKIKLPLDKIKSVIKKWMFEFPNPYVSACSYPGMHNFVDFIQKESNIKIVIYSDYDAKQKLAALSINADLVLAATDSEINCLKPHPKALFYLMEKLDVRHDECLYIGDRDELDGVCAREAKVAFMNLKNDSYITKEFYNELLKSFKHFKEKNDGSNYQTASCS